MKDSRNKEDVRKSLKALAKKAERNENLIPPIIEAARAQASLGEIHGTVRIAMGYEYDPFGVLKYPF